MSRKRALFLINSLAGGGAERVMCTLLRYSEDERQEFDIVLGLLDDEPAAYAPPDWVEVRQFDCGKSFPRSVSAVRGLVSELRPDVTLSFLTRSNMANVLSSGSGARVISERANTSAHFGNGPGGLASRTLVRLLYPRADRVIAVSDGVADDLRDNFGIRADKLSAIPNPIDVDAITTKAELAPEIDVGTPYVLAAGRLVKSKNFEMLIRAFAEAKMDGRTLVIIGEGPERATLEQAAAAAGVGLEQHTLGRLRRQPLVPERDRQISLGQQIAGKLPHRLAARPLAAVHVQGQADDQAADIVFGDQVVQGLRVERELSPGDGFERGGDGEPDVAHGKADRLFAQVKAEQALTGFQGLGQFGRRFDDHGVERSLLASVGGGW